MRKARLALVLAAACGTRQEPVSVPSEPRTPTAPADAPPPAPRPTETAATREVARTLEVVSRLRGVAVKRPVPGVRLGRTELVGKVKDKAMREVPPDALRREGELLQLFGFAPESFDYVAETMALLEEQLEGFYEPADGTMYLASDLRGEEAKAALAHELVHALQDQSWDLRSRSTYRPGRSDETLALAALAEGDATSAMVDFMLESQHKTALDLPESATRALMSGASAAGAAASVPHILRSSLVAPYIEGLGFVHGLRQKGGWAAVDRAWARPPVSTEQILHVEKWEANELPLKIAAPPAASLGAGFALDDEDTFGELGLALAFGEWLSEKDAHVAASGWGGDRSSVWVRGHEMAAAIRVRFDDGSALGKPSAYADRALQKVSLGLKRKLGPAAIDTPETICFERARLGPLALSKKDRDLVLALGPARVGGPGAGGWASAGTCAQAKKWVSEIHASP